MPQVWPSKAKKKKRQGSAEYGSQTKSFLAVSVNKLFLKHIHIHSFVISHACFHTTMSIVATNTIWHSKPNTNWPFEKKSGSVLYKMHWRDITKYKICDSLILDSKGKTVPKLKVIFGGKWEYPPKYWVYSQLDYILAIIHVNFLICDEGIMVM